MRVLFPDISKPASGRGFFLNALAKELPHHRVQVVYEGDHDLSLHSIRMWCKTNKPRILRLDGVYHDTGKDWRIKNIGLAEHAAAADGVICQSEFSKQMVMRYLGVPEEKIRVIFNGAEKWSGVTRHFNFKHNFIAASKWRPHKRLNDIIESFVLADIPNSCLHVIGSTEKAGLPSGKKVDDIGYWLNGHSIEVYGKTEHDTLMLYFYYATASVHLCWFDACPNSVVEAIVAGCPVITNNVGGTHEIVRPSGGIVLDLDEPYDYRPVDLYNPPAIDRYKVAEAMRRCAEARPSITRDHVDIRNIAAQYKTYFERFV